MITKGLYEECGLGENHRLSGPEKGTVTIDQLGKGVSYTKKSGAIESHRPSPFNGVSQSNIQEIDHYHSELVTECLTEDEAKEKYMGTLTKGMVSTGVTVGGAQSQRTSAIQKNAKSYLVCVYIQKKHIFQVTDFLETAKNMLIDNNTVSANFLQTYGSHYISSLSYGASFIAEIDNQDTLSTQNSTFQAIAEVKPSLTQNSIGSSKAQENQLVLRSSGQTQGVSLQQSTLSLARQNEVEKTYIAKATSIKCSGLPISADLSPSEAYSQFIQHIQMGTVMTSCLEIALSPWTACQLGYRFSSGQEHQALKKMLEVENNFYTSSHSDSSIRYDLAAKEILAAYADTSFPRETLRIMIQNLKSSPKVFPFALALLQTHGLDLLKIFFPKEIQAVALGIHEKKYFKISPTLYRNTHYVAMESTLGWLRDQTCISDQSSWKLEPVDQGRYFLLSCKKWPEHFAYMRGFDHAGRTRGYQYGSIATAQQDESAIWILTPVVNDHNHVTFQISPKKWPTSYLFMKNITLGWINADRNPGPQGQFYIEPL